MRKSRLAIIAGILLASSTAFADPPDNRPPDNRPPDRGGSNEQGQQQGQAQGQLQAQGQIAVGVGGDGGDSSSSARASGGRGGSSSVSGNSLSATTGESRSSASATSGDSSAGGGDSSSNIAIDGDERAASSAAAVYAAYCTQGASAQGMGGGGAITGSDPVCDLMKIADRSLLAWNQCREAKGSCTPEQEADYLAEYHQNLGDAEAIVQRTKITGEVSKQAGNLVIPGAILWALLLL